ncbi:hypothetical protein CONLIGDRAFT_411841 [Coniochaeta ligniaria NRRL 30616]|uniref:Uncharacterized protein n=1 Tax=Coniochaeta ligniaria NRRL 30616 TaxID=1408157 RepID=A0A1J7IPX5_9PEZI|nr:hypothetical protein CONLIGDRAFT_411841 [Coniochaeta ligniaria NRRL 30616]
MAPTLDHESDAPEARPGTSTQSAVEPRSETTHTTSPIVNTKPSCDTQHEISPAQVDQILPATSESATQTPEDGSTIPLADGSHPVELKRFGVEAETVIEVQSVSGLTPSLLSQPPRAGTVHSQGSEDSKEKKRIDIRWTKSEADPMPGIHWYYPVVMIFLALGGLFGAIGHHLYNVSLAGKEVVGDGQWPQRWGVALAFFIKMMLGAAVQTAFKQRAWLTIKKRAFKVKTLNSIFHACYDPAEFFDKDLFLGAFLPALLALLIWLLPLSAIATPSTLTVADGSKSYSTMCNNVSTLNFNRENGFDMNVWDRTQDKNGMSFWDMYDNTTSYYAGPSMDLRRTFNLAMLSTNPIQPDRSWTTDPIYINPLQPNNPCPTDSSCTYSVTFNAPSYKCEERDEFGGNTTLKKSMLAPYGDLVYVSYSSVDEDNVGRPLDWNTTDPTYDNTGTWTQEPSVWFGYSYNTTKNATAENATQWNTTNWPAQLTHHVIECSLYNATYSFTLSFLISGVMVVTGYSIDYIGPLLPQGQTMAPWMPTYMEFSGFHAGGYLYRNLLSGNVTQEGDWTWAITNSDISQTDITDPGTGLSHEDALGPYIETGFQSIYLAMLSDWKTYAQNFSSLPCEVNMHLLVWRYNPLWLAISYFIAVALTFAAVGIGLHAIVANGYAMETNFSTFLTTTRNPDLDEVVRGSSLGASPLKRAVRETKLRFGETVRPEGAEGTPHAAFGFPEQIRTLKKGKQYA